LRRGLPPAILVSRTMTFVEGATTDPRAPVSDVNAALAGAWSELEDSLTELIALVEPLDEACL
jgi:hypothetical protein